MESPESPLDAVRASLKDTADQIDAIIQPALDEKRELSDDESAKVEALEADADKIERSLDRFVKQGERRAKSAVPGLDVKVKRESLTYERGNGHSYLQDLAKSQCEKLATSPDREGAIARITRHKVEMEVEVPIRMRQRDAASAKEARDLGPESPFERRVNPNRTAGQGGEFVPPLWLEQDWIAYLRAGRVTANLCRQLTLPDGTNSINYPKVNNRITTAIQTADGASVSSTDMTTTSVSAAVQTIAGQQDVSRQLIDQSPAGFDEVVTSELLADYNKVLDTQVLSGTGSSGQVTGIDSAGGNSVTFTSGSPTAILLHPIILQGLSQVARQRFMPANAIVMHPRRWFWLLGQLDGNNRPFVTAYPQSAFNPLGQSTTAVQGPAGNYQGTDVYLDANVTTTDNTNQDRIYAAYWNDLLLFEGALRTAVYTETLSGTLQVRLQVYNYVAFMGTRYPVGTSIISGTGLAVNSGY